MRLEFNNFARAGKGVIELNDLTVICGPNNSGKTYLNYAVFSILNRIEDYFDISISTGDAESAFVDLTTTGSCELKFTESSFGEKRFFKNIGKRIATDLHAYFGLPDSHFSELEMSLNLEKLNTKNIDTNNLFVTPNLKASIIFDNNINIILSIVDKSFFNDHINYKFEEYGVFKYLIKKFIFSEIVSKQIESPFSITSERTGIAMFYRIFDEKNTRLIGNINEKVRISDIIESRSDLSLPIHENIKFVRYYPGLLNKKSKFTKSHQKYKGIFLTLSDLLDGGEFQPLNGAIYYIPNKKLPVQEPPTPLNATSSSLKSLFLLDLYLKHIADEGQILIIDEPELNLFPVNQAKMARLIAKMVNAGIKVLVSTHSDYFVREINNLIALNSVYDDKKMIMDKYDYEDDVILDHKKVNCFNTTKKYKVEKMKVDKFGIDNKIFDSIIDDENERNDLILSCVEE